MSSDELLHGFRHCVAQLGLIAAVRLDGDGAHAADRNLLHQFIRLVRRGGVSQGDAGAIFRRRRTCGTMPREPPTTSGFVFQGLHDFVMGMLRSGMSGQEMGENTESCVLPWGLGRVSAARENRAVLQRFQLGSGACPVLRPA